MTLTSDPPSDVDVEEREDGDDDAEDGGEDIFDCQDPGGRGWYRVRRRGSRAVGFGDVVGARTGQGWW